MTVSGIQCPVCDKILLAGSTICTNCGEDLAAIVHLGMRSQVCYNDGLRLAQSGNRDSAIRAMLAAVDADASNVGALVVLGKLYAQAGQWAQARSAWEQALRLVPGENAARAGLERLKEIESRAAAAQASTALAARRRQWFQIAAAFLVGMITLFLAVVIFPQAIAPAQVALAPTNSPPASPVQPPPTAVTRPIPTVVATPTQVPATVVATPDLPVSSPTPAPSPIADLHSPVEAALKAQPSLANIQMTVEQDGSIVRLKGEVPSLSVRYLVETTARSAAGAAIVDLSGLVITSKYIVQPQDSLWKIAIKVYGSPDRWQKIAESNHLNPPYTLQVGQELIVPSE